MMEHERWVFRGWELKKLKTSLVPVFPGRRGVGGLGAVGRSGEMEMFLRVSGRVDEMLHDDDG